VSPYIALEHSRFNNEEVLCNWDYVEKMIGSFKSASLN